MARTVQHPHDLPWLRDQIASNFAFACGHFGIGDPAMVAVQDVLDRLLPSDPPLYWVDAELVDPAADHGDALDEDTTVDFPSESGLLFWGGRDVRLALDPARPAVPVPGVMWHIDPRVGGLLMWLTGSPDAPQDRHAATEPVMLPSATTAAEQVPATVADFGGGAPVRLLAGAFALVSAGRVQRDQAPFLHRERKVARRAGHRTSVERWAPPTG